MENYSPCIFAFPPNDELSLTLQPTQPFPTLRRFQPRNLPSEHLYPEVRISDIERKLSISLAPPQAGGSEAPFQAPAQSLRMAAAFLEEICSPPAANRWPNQGCSSHSSAPPPPLGLLSSPPPQPFFQESKGKTHPFRRARAAPRLEQITTSTQ